MGKFSREKGKRAEYALRDEIRRYGFTADRVPSSGASQGFKGDIRFSKDGKTYLAELKARKDEFKQVYALFDRISKDEGDKIGVCIGGQLVNISSSLLGVFEDCGIYRFADQLPCYREFKRTFAKILNMKALVKDCDMLAVRDDRKPFLFLRYR
jgi:hypothetical protein